MYLVDWTFLDKDMTIESERSPGSRWSALLGCIVTRRCRKAG
jgi:hypothetical protein